MMQTSDIDWSKEIDNSILDKWCYELAQSTEYANETIFSVINSLIDSGYTRYEPNPVEDSGGTLWNGEESFRIHGIVEVKYTELVLKILNEVK